MNSPPVTGLTPSAEAADSLTATALNPPVIVSSAAATAINPSLHLSQRYTQQMETDSGRNLTETIPTRLAHTLTMCSDSNLAVPEASSIPQSDWPW